MSAPAVGSRWIDRDGAEWLVARVDGDAVRLQRETVGGLRTYECDPATLRRRFAHVETWFVLTDRETGRRITGVPGDAPCRVMREFRAGKLTRAEWKALADDASEEPTPDGLRVLRWEEVLRDLARCRHRRRGLVCSDRCAKSRERGARDHGDPTVPFLRGSCMYCHAALVDGCPDCGWMNARHAPRQP